VRASTQEKPMDFAVPFAGVPTVAVKDSGLAFPARRVYCVGRNYADHAREMGHDPEREEPFFFMKPADALVVCKGGGTRIAYPPKTADLHHEIELVVALGAGGSDVTADQAEGLIFGYAVGIDLTRRDLQGEAKERRRPWEVGKSFDGAAPLSLIVTADAIGHPSTGRIWLAVDDEIRQDGDLAQMIWRVPEIIAHLSGFFSLAPGDLIFTGTPAGVGPLKPGEHITGGIDGIGEIGLAIV
jgi:fumarylpyruvate hydrolase